MNKNIRIEKWTEKENSWTRFFDLVTFLNLSYLLHKISPSRNYGIFELSFNRLRERTVATLGVCLMLGYSTNALAIIPFGFIRKPPSIDCTKGSPSPGALCSGGTYFLGTLTPGATSGSGTDRYMTTPGGCGEIPAVQKVTTVNTPTSDYPNADFTPTCTGSDNLSKTWNDGSANYAVVPGLTDYTTTRGTYGDINTDLNYGFTNTTNIVAISAVANGGYHAAALYCDKLNFGGYRDWFLPNRYELNLFWTNKTKIPGLDIVNWYWSSTEHDSNQAWVESFGGGSQDRITKSYTASKLRCVRRIDPCTEGTPNPGDRCNDGTFYVGTLNGYKYKTTPGGCTDSATPICNNGTDTLNKIWGAYASATGKTSRTDGPGNSAGLVAYGDTMAAKYCENMIYAGYTDWFWPAKDELNLLATPMTASQRAAIGVDVSGAHYWSSTEDDNWRCHSQAFNNGTQYIDTKDYSTRIRCFRRF